MQNPKSTQDFNLHQKMFALRKTNEEREIEMKEIQITNNTKAVIDGDYVAIEQSTVLSGQVETVLLTHDNMIALIEAYQSRVAI